MAALSYLAPQFIKEGRLCWLHAPLYIISDGKKVTIGENTVKGAKVKATVVGHGKSKKIVVYKYKAKKNERKTRGHRQPYTKIQIEKITTTAPRAKKEETETKEA